MLECYLREKTQDEAAKALGWSLSTVRRRLGRAKELLRVRLSARGAGLAAVLSAGAVAGTASAAVPAELARAAVQVGAAGRAGGAVASGVGSLAGAGGGTPVVVKAALGIAAAGAVAAGVGVGFGGWGTTPAPQAVEPPAVVAVAVPEVVPEPRRVPAEPEIAPPPRPVVPPRPPTVVPPAPVPPSTTPPALSEWVTIRGRVKLPTPSTPRPIDATTDREFCTKDGPLFDESLVVSAAGGVKNVVVWLRPDSTDRKATFPADKIHPALAQAPPTERVIDQPCCQFEPRLTAARTGDRLVVKNSAKVAHNINISGGDENPGLVSNSTLHQGKDQTFGPLAAQRTPIPFKCDIHPWMKGYIRVFDHPYFAVTDADGKFEIPHAPPGTWRLVIWHENGFHKGREGVLGLPVELQGATTEVPAIELELPKP